MGSERTTPLDSKTPHGQLSERKLLRAADNTVKYHIGVLPHNQ